MPSKQQFTSCVLTLVVAGVFVIILHASGHIGTQSDSLHLSPKGAARFGRLLDNAVRDYVQKTKMPSLAQPAQGEGPRTLQEGEKQEASAVIGVDQEDPALAAYIRSRIVAPSVLSYNLSRPRVEHFSQFRERTFLMTDLLNQTEGFFVEAGAADGEFLSNTLYLERRLGWRGLLVEAFPGSYEKLLFKRRKAYSLQAALSPTSVSSFVKFRTVGKTGVLGHIADDTARGAAVVTVEAYPLYSILHALNVTVIDFLSLDVEGFELKVLKTVPWDKIKVRLMSVEYLHIPEGYKALHDFMTSKGYRLIRATHLDAWFGLPELLDKPKRKN